MAVKWREDQKRRLEGLKLEAPDQWYEEVTKLKEKRNAMMRRQRLRKKKGVEELLKLRWSKVQRVDGTWAEQPWVFEAMGRIDQDVLEGWLKANDYALKVRKGRLILDVLDVTDERIVKSVDFSTRATGRVSDLRGLVEFWSVVAPDDVGRFEGIRTRRELWIGEEQLRCVLGHDLRRIRTGEGVGEFINLARLGQYLDDNEYQLSFLIEAGDLVLIVGTDGIIERWPITVDFDPKVVVDYIKSLGTDDERIQ